MAGVLSLNAAIRSMEEGEGHVYQTLFGDHPKGEGFIVSPRYILRMHIKKTGSRGWTSTSSEGTKPSILRFGAKGFSYPG